MESDTGEKKSYNMIKNGKICLNQSGERIWN